MGPLAIFDAAKLALRLAGVAAIFAVGAAADRALPIIGANARVSHWKQAAEAWQASAGDWQRYGLGEAAAFRADQAARQAEGLTAINAVTQEGQRCTARLAWLRTSEAAIRSITNTEVPHDALGCPVRSLVPYDRLRDATGAPAVN